VEYIAPPSELTLLLLNLEFTTFRFALLIEIAPPSSALLFTNVLFIILISAFSSA
jgi:hypothetical protein